MRYFCAWPRLLLELFAPNFSSYWAWWTKRFTATVNTAKHATGLSVVNVATVPFSADLSRRPLTIGNRNETISQVHERERTAMRKTENNFRMPEEARRCTKMTGVASGTTTVQSTGFAKLDENDSVGSILNVATARRWHSRRSKSDRK